jgi:probable HAF family extracellular repeat protein
MKMKIKSSRNNLKLATCLAVCLPYATANAVIQYSVTDIGNLGGTYSLGLGVNNTGITVGLSHLPDNVSEHAIAGEGLAIPQNLGTLGGGYSQAYGINNLGQVVGSSMILGDTLFHAFQWQGPIAPPLSPLKDLKALVEPGYSRAFSINEHGQSTGFSSTLAGTEHAVVWQTTGAITDLGTLDGTGNSQGLAINLSGQVAGFSTLTGNKATHAVLWSSGANGIAKRDLGTLGGSHSAAYGVNASGQVVGSAATALDAQQHAFLWQSNVVPPMKDLGTLGSAFSEARAISSAGDVVGTSTATSGTNAPQKAFLWQSGVGIQDLNTLIDPASGWTLLEANAISEDGAYIAGIGSTADGVLHAVLLKRLIVDTTPPVVTFLVVPGAAGPTGWYLTTPVVTWSVSDSESPVSAKVGCTDTTVANTTGDLLSCTATSLGGTTGPINTPTIKVDTTLPTLVVPTAITQAAVNATGAVVIYTPTATDTFSGVSLAGVSCTPSSGSTFGLGTTPVTCSVSDNAGNRSTANFAVTVADQTPPVIANIPAITREATSATGAVISYLPTATDNVTSSPIVSCIPASGSTFVLGTTAVNCSARDAAGNTSAASFAVTVADTTPPVLTVPAAFSRTAVVGANGAVVTYVASATDAVSGINAAGVSCLPASGATLPLGANTVSCSATDNAGNSKSASFVVTVLSAADTTPPVITPTVTGTTGLNGWFIGPVTVSWSVTDGQSAVTSPACASVVIATNGAAQTRSCTATSAGGTATVSTPSISIDTQAPSFVCPTAVTLTSPATLTVPTATDNLSAANVTRTPVGTLPVGTTAVTWIATDQAGNSTPATCVQQVTVNAPVTETITVTRPQCKVKSATSGEWTMQGTSTISTNNRIQLYSTATVPTVVTSNTLGASVPVSGGAWQFQAKPGPACVTPISVRSTATGTVRENIAVQVQ